VAAGGVRDRIRFEHRNVSKGLPEPYDVITTFDVMHNAVDPLGLATEAKFGNVRRVPRENPFSHLHEATAWRLP
jgi:hypothetical protein